MDDDTRPRDAAEAFDDMGRQFALMRRAVEGLSAEKERMPDYSETLGQVVRHIAGIERTLAALAKAPAMQLTPEAFAVEMIQAAQDVRAQDAETISRAVKALTNGAATLERAMESARTAQHQKRVVLRAVGIAAAVTLFVMLILPGIVYRALPERWLIPEKAAARMLRLDRWQAGERLLSTADPDRWRAVVLADTIVHENRDAIMACRRMAAKGKEPMRCTVSIANPSPN